MKRLALCAGLLFAALPAFAQEHETEAKKLAESRGVTEHGDQVYLGMGQLPPAGRRLRLPRQEERRPILRPALAADSQGHGGRRTGRARRPMPRWRKWIAASRISQADIEALRRDAHQEAEAEAQRVRREAAAEMAKIQARTIEEIAAAGKAARLDLRRYSAGLALSLAETKIAARLSPQVQDAAG